MASAVKPLNPIRAHEYRRVSVRVHVAACAVLVVVLSFQRGAPAFRDTNTARSSRRRAAA